MRICLATSLLGIGCSTPQHKWVKVRPAIYKASGKVLYQGKPLEGAIVLYHPIDGNTAAHGRTNSKGEFDLTTFVNRDGAPAGSYHVVVTKMEYDEKPTAYDSPHERSVAQIGKQLLPAKYTNKETTILTVEIHSKGPNNSIFDITGEP